MASRARLMARLYAALPPELSLRIQGQRRLGYVPSLRHPTRFNELLQVLKVAREDHPRFAALADKLRVKEHVAREIGDKYVIPTLWSGDRLPDAPQWPFPFVVKANHGSGWNAFVRSEDEWEKARSAAEKWQSSDYFPHNFESWYHEIDRKILIEGFLGENVTDYKFFCFSGEVKTIQVDSDRFTEHRRSFYAPDWELEPFSLVYPPIEHEVDRPTHLDEMIEIAEKLSKGMPFVRIDLYDLEDGPKFGEFTFAPESGFGRFTPEEYDRELGTRWLEGTQGERLNGHVVNRKG